VTVSSAPRTRRHGEALEAAIFDAVIEQLRVTGFAGLTMENVASAAGTGKAALYRRWSAREDLVAAALCYALPSPADLPTGTDLRVDLLTLLRFLRDAIELSRGAMVQLSRSPTQNTSGLLHEVIKERISQPCLELLHQALIRGVERGEVRPEKGTMLVARVGPAVLVHHYMSERASITDEFLAEIVDELILPIVRPAGHDNG
jgi:AcrR family transcriptional regulator